MRTSTSIPNNKTSKPFFDPAAVLPIYPPIKSHVPVRFSYLLSPQPNVSRLALSPIAPPRGPELSQVAPHLRLARHWRVRGQVRRKSGRPSPVSMVRNPRNTSSHKLLLSSSLSHTLRLRTGDTVAAATTVPLHDLGRRSRPSFLGLVEHVSATALPPRCRGCGCGRLHAPPWQASTLSRLHLFLNKRPPIEAAAAWRRAERRQQLQRLGSGEIGAETWRARPRG